MLFGYFSWPLFSGLWAWAMTSLLFFSIYLLLKPTKDQALLIPNWRVFAMAILLLFWPPISFSLGQLTMIWLVCVILAFHYRANPFFAGILIAIASFTKLMPIVMLIPFLLRKQYLVMFGFLLAWVIALILLFLIDPNIWRSYLRANRMNFLDQILRPDSASFFIFPMKQLGMPGIIFTLILLLAVGFLLLNLYQGSNRQKSIDLFEWNGWVLISILCLPITWIYSLAPLLPLLFLFFQSKKIGINVLAAIAVLVPIGFPPFGEKSTYGIFLFLLLMLIGVWYSRDKHTHTSKRSA